MRRLSNISIKELRAVLLQLGLSCDGIKGGHEKWSKDGMTRPIVFQTHKDPVPEFIVKNAIRDLGMSRQDFLSILETL